MQKEKETSTNPSVLESVRVLDFSHILAGPYCTRQLSDLGAEVIKIERPPEGETSRAVGLHYWQFCNCGKKSICLDLTQAKSVRIVHELVEKCDVVVESFRPGKMDKLGVGYADLKRVNPKIILCSLTGFGQNNPYSKFPGTAVVAHAMTGLMSLQGNIVDPDGPPVAPAFAIGDMGAALHAVSAICAALYYREKTGIGQYIDISLIDSLFGMNDRVQQEMIEKGDAKAVSATPVFAGKDGYLSIAPASEEMFARLWKVMGKGDISVDSRFSTPEARFAHYFNEWNQIIQEWVQSFNSVQEVVSILEKVDVLSTPILSVSDAIKHPYIVSRGMVREIDDPVQGKIKILNSAFRFSETTSELRGNLPKLGEHNHEILRSLLDYSAEEVAQLHEEGVLSSKKYNN